MSSSVVFVDRESGQEVQETIYGDRALRWAYETTLGRFITAVILIRAFVSKLYGLYQSSRFSASKIAPFIESFKIPMALYDEGPFRSFNEFFIRKFKEGSRTFQTEKGQLSAFAEGRYLVYESVDTEQPLHIKNQNLKPSAILGDAGLAREFEGGPVVIARLCPVDYHRFHFPDAGSKGRHYRVPGIYHSVNPVALHKDQEIFAKNERQVTILKTENFGDIAYVEVGALCVGRIVQSHAADRFERGDEKGYFLFGGSTVVIFGQKGRWLPDADLLRNTLEGKETFVKLGESIAHTLAGI